MFTGMMQSVLLRSGQIAVEASSTFLIGLVVAAVMRRMMGQEGIRRLFAGSGWKGLLRAWVIGTLLPVCSLGVIPVIRELRRAGVRSGTVLAFALAAPQLNPLSLLYGLTLSEPIVIVSFVLATLVLAVLGGALWDGLFARPQDTLTPEPEQTPAPGLKRLGAIGVTAARDAVGPTLAYAVLGVCVTGLVAGLLPYGLLSTSMRHDDPLSPLLMLLLGVPMYSGVLPGMMRIGLMFDHGNSVGAAFILFEVGVGLNAGLVLFLALQFGVKRTLPWLALMLAIIVGCAYAAERPLYFAHEEAGHTHAFDEWSSPFHTWAEGSWSVVGQKIAQKVEILEPFALGGLAVLWLVGGLLRWFDPTERLDRWLTETSVELPPEKRSLLNWYVPGPILGLVALVLLVMLSVVALYIYYPGPRESFEQMVRVRAEALTAVNAGKREEAIRQIEHYDLLTRKLQVGVFIRTGELAPDAAKAAADLRECLEQIRDAVIAGQLAEARALIPQAEAAFRHCRETFRRYDQTPGQ